MLTVALIALAASLTAIGLLCAHPRTRALLRDGQRLLRALARDERIPRPLRWLLVFALLPIPGPFEEIAGGVALSVIAWKYERVLSEHRR